MKTPTPSALRLQRLAALSREDEMVEAYTTVLTNAPKPLIDHLVDDCGWHLGDALGSVLTLMEESMQDTADSYLQ